MLELNTEEKAVNPKSQLKYEQLKRLLLDQMASGKLRPGDMLPPEVDIAQQMGIARNTVRQAMRDLEDKQVIRRIRGKGTIVCEAKPKPRSAAQTADQLFGLILPELRAGMYQSLQAGLNNSMSPLGANMIVCDVSQDLYKQVDALLQLAYRGVSGLAMVPITSTKTPTHHLALLRRSELPLVFCHRRVEGIQAPLIGFSPYDIGSVSGAELARYGHRHVAMIFSHFSQSCEHRIRGVRDALKEVGGGVPDEFIYYDNSFRSDSLPPGLEDRLEEHIKKMLAHEQPPTGFVVSADILAGVTCLVLQKLGMSVPEDVSVIGFGDRSSRTTVLPCQLQSVTVNEWELGRIAFDTLREIQLGKLPFDSDKEIMMPLEVAEGESIGPIKGSST